MPKNSVTGLRLVTADLKVSDTTSVTITVDAEATRGVMASSTRGPGLMATTESSRTHGHD